MPVSGKILGGMIGLCVGLPLAGPYAILFVLGGAALGHLLDVRNDPGRFDPVLRAPTRAEIDREARERFAAHVARLLLHVARADGSVAAEAMAAVDRYFVERLGYDAEDAAVLDRALAEGSEAAGDLAAACERCREALTEAERLLLLGALYDVASADRPVSRPEAAVIEDVARRLGLPDADRARARLPHVPPAADAAYTVLGLASDAADAAVKRAFRRLAARHHPDKVAHLGEKPMALAAARFNEIREAYEAIRLARGF